ncbi:hypothetical protein E2C01_084280 [Portunus trituberculatus]|uniref:Uncharacterized protein n=1 Tax=Portunus trituberculatus TaxID=210409 RepID=A0A5B7IXW1_PORTR|nr:hypothetical protein [Portunus trituberculatus]
MTSRCLCTCSPAITTSGSCLRPSATRCWWTSWRRRQCSCTASRPTCGR